LVNLLADVLVAIKGFVTISILFDEFKSVSTT